MRSTKRPEVAVAVPGNALKKWEKVRGFALCLTLKLTDEAGHAHTLTSPGAEPAGYGLGRSGWVRMPLAELDTHYRAPIHRLSS